jgi:PKD repeat protein
MCKKLLISILFIFSLAFAFAQTAISGIINTYTKVNTIDTCQNNLNVASIAGFKKGENVLLIQMKGAIINEGQSSVYGNVVNMKSAGLYEVNTVDSIFSNIVFLKNKFINYYQSTASLQLITIPTFQNAVVSDTLRAKAWDGQTGGVLIFEVKNELGLLSYIEANGKGFRGGKANPKDDPSNSCQWFLSIADYFLPSNNWRGAEKGEGIALVTAGKEAGRGAQLNGGGGGNDHNAGGGGGSNIAKGGQGGTMTNNSTFGCTGPNPGLGGKAIALINNRLYLGGGGGSGHGNNGAATNGGAGGGLIFIKAKKIIGAGTRIFANGENAKNTVGDGAGAGGAGGTVLLDITEVTGNLFVQATGGKGGRILDNGDSRCFGPGGGGGGGRVIISSNLPTVAYDLKGGANGIVEGSICGNSANAAQKGDDGGLELNQFLAYSTQPFEQVSIVKQDFSDTLCLGKIGTLEVKTKGVGLQYQWQQNTGSGFQNISNGLIFKDTDKNVLSILNPSAALASTEFQCVITSICGTKITSKPIKVFLREAPKAGFIFTKNGSLVNFMNTSQMGVTYSWAFADGTFSNEKNPSHLYTQDGTFAVELTVQGECGIAFITQTITIVTPPKAAFSADTLIGCAPFKVKFKNQSSQNTLTYKWTFMGADIATSTLKEPTVTYLKSGVYGVTLEVANSQFTAFENKGGYIIVSEKPSVDFAVKSQNGTAMTFDNKAINGNSFVWEFGDTKTSTDKDPTHLYAADGEYLVKLTATNNCGTSSFSQYIKVVSLPKAAFSTSVKSGCAPLSVQFTDESKQALTKRKWTFKGAKQDTSSQKNPTIIYDKAGIYPVKLWVANSSGKDSVLSQDFIQVFDKPSVDFSLSATKLSLKSDNKTTDATTYAWSISNTVFSSKDKNITFIAPKSGTYTVKLAATNQCGTVTLNKDITVSNELECNEIEATLSPNPADNYVFLKFNAIRKTKMPYLLCTIDGRIIEQGEYATDFIEKEIDVSNLANGIYILHFQCDTKVFNKKLFITKNN